MTKNSFSWLRDRWRALSWFFGIPSHDSQSLTSPSAPLLLAPPPNPRRKLSKVIEPIEDPFISSDHKKYFQYLVDSHQALEVYEMHNTFKLMVEDVFVSPHLALAPYLPVDKLPLSHLSLAQLRQDQHNLWKFVALEHTPALVITGSPGSGKTSLLKYITLNLLNKEKRLSGEVPNKLPILLSLRQHSKIINRNSDYTLAEATESAYLSHMLEPLPSNWFEKHLQAQECVVMLDGLDEIADQVERQNVTAWIEAQIARYPKNHFIITSRPLNYFTHPIRGATVLESLPFDKTQIQQVIERWYLSNEINNTKSSKPRTASEGIKDLTQLSAKPPFSALSKNPLLLTMIATMHRAGISLPRSRADLYTEITLFFLRSSANQSQFDLTPAQKLNVLQPLAYHMMRHKQSEIELAEASRVIYVTLDIISRNPKGVEFLQMIADTSPLLIEQENGKYRFIHRTFQEYLAAIHMLEYRLEGQLIKHVEDVWWHETICLYGSCTDATPIIAACLRESQPSANALIMACHCLLEAHHIQPEWQNKLTSILQRYVEDENSVLRRIVTETLLELRLRRMMPVNNKLSVADSLITNSEYQIFIDHQRARDFKPSHWFAHSFQPRDGLKPVVGVRPSEAVLFCQWLTERDKEGRTYRLPYTNEFSPLLSKVGYWTQDPKNDQVYNLENEQPVSLSITTLEQRFYSVLLSDLTCHPDEALERVRDLARALEDLLERNNDTISRDALILVRDFVHERAHNRALHLDKLATPSGEETQWYTHFISWLVTEKLVTILRQQAKPRSWLDTFDRHRSKKPFQLVDSELLTEQYFELYVDLANLEEHHQSQLLASRGIRIAASSPAGAAQQRKAFKKEKPKAKHRKRAVRSASAPPTSSRSVGAARKVIQKKICVLGDEAVGKTSLMRRYVEGRFDDKYLSTVGVSISRKTLVLPSYTMNMLLWDMEGAPNLKKTQVNYLRGAAGALIVCDLSRRETLAAFERYAHQLRALNKNVPFVLVGNKVDLDDRDVLGSELEKIAKNLKAPYLLTSAKTGTQVEEAFRILADLIEQQEK